MINFDGVLSDECESQILSVMTNKELHDAIGNAIIAAARMVREEAGPGLRESDYETALTYELVQAGHTVQRQCCFNVTYKGIDMNEHIVVDMLVDDLVIVELKSLPYMYAREYSQLITYLKLSGKKLGFLINFGSASFAIGKFKESLPYYNAIYRVVNGLY